MRFAKMLLVSFWVAALGSCVAVASEPSSARNSDSPVIAEVLGRQITADEIEVDDEDTRRPLRYSEAIARHILPPLVERYINEHQLTATDEEIKEYRDWTFPDEVAGEVPDEVRWVAKHIVENWKFNKALYEKHGGRLVFQQFGVEPLDAHRAWLLDEKEAGNFRVLTPEWEDALWEYYKPKYHRIVDSADYFEVPYWRQ